MSNGRQCRSCWRGMRCDWDLPPADPCPDYREDPNPVPEIPATMESFDKIQGRDCLVKFPHGREFRGRPVKVVPGEFILVETGEDEMVAVEFGHGAEIHLLE